MAFNTITFLFFFFPVTLLLFFLTPKKYRQYTLLITSFIFYCWGDTKNLIFILFSALFSYLSAIEIENLQKENKDKENKIVFITTIIAHIGLLAFFKYAGLMSMPLGISFYTFSVLSYIFDVYYGKCGAENNILNYLLYVSFFPKVISGPIIQFHDFKNQLANRIVTRRGVVEGTQLFMLGLFKKVLLADQLGMAYSSFAQTDTVVGSYFTVISYGLQLYFDFSGYSDMAIGLASIFGFHFGKNFDEPYTSHSISEFWRRWHISLGAWFRDYVYIPLGGNRVDTKRHIMNLLVVWLLTGIWHGNTLGFIIWGLYHGFFVIGEKYFFHDLHQRIKPGLQVALTNIIVFIGWIFFFSPTISDAFGLAGRLLGIHASGFISRQTIYYLLGNGLIVIAGILCCMPVIINGYKKIFMMNKKRMIFHLIFQVILLIICIAYMIGSTYSSFLYFAF